MSDGQSGLGFGRRKLIDKIIEENWEITVPSGRTYTYNEILYIIQEMVEEEGKQYLEPGTPMRGFQVFKDFVKHLLYRNLANFDSMVLVTAEKGVGKSSAAIMMAREWCKLLGIRFDPKRHIAYNNSDMMIKIDLLNKFEPLIADEAVRFACVTGDTLIQMPCDRDKYPKGVPIKELANKKNFYVYSFNHKIKKIELKKARICIQTKFDDVYELSLKSGKKLKCTKEHKIMMMDGSFKTIEQLMNECNDTWFEGGFNRKYIPGEYMKYPPSSYKPATSKIRTFVELTISKKYVSFSIDYNKNGLRPKEEHRFIIEQLYGKCDLAHHKDENIHNNTIENIEDVSKAMHNKLHPHSGHIPSIIPSSGIRTAPTKQFYVAGGIARRLKRCGDYIVDVKYVGKEDVYDILDVVDNNNYIANGVMVHNSAADWAKKENKELKKKLAQVRTKHLFFILCFPLKVYKLEKTYLESFVNYWCDLFSRGQGAIYVKDKNPTMDSWRMKEFAKVGSYTEFTNVTKIKDKLKKHPNFWTLIKFPKPPKWLYARYIKVREKNIYDDENVMSNISKEDIHRSLLILALKDIMTNDVTFTMNRIILHIKNEYDINITKGMVQSAVDDATQLVSKIRELSLNG